MQTSTLFQMAKRKKTILINILLVFCSIVIGLIIAEALLRAGKPYRTFGAGRIFPMQDNQRDLSKAFTVDPDFGFRPVLGNNYSGYSRYGTIVNSYSIQKRPGVIRVLFIGDSVTGRGKIIYALRQLYGEDKFEYWNAGVESFNTVQEVKYYKKYNSQIKPDLVVLTFHNNDFETTPIAFADGSHKIYLYAPNKPLQNLNPWLLKNSHLYRLIVGAALAKKKERESIADEIRQSLVELRDILYRDNIALTVLIHPVLKPSHDWSSEEVYSRTKIISLLDELGIRYFDLYPISEKAMKENVHVQEGEGDILHPSSELSALFAQYLFKNGLLTQN